MTGACQGAVHFIHVAEHSVHSNTWKASRSLPSAPFLLCSLTPFPWPFHSTGTDGVFGEMGGAGVLAKEMQLLFISTARLNYALPRHHPQPICLQSVQPQSPSLDMSLREQHPALLSAPEINPRALMPPACWTHLCFLPDSLKPEWHQSRCFGHSSLMENRIWPRWLVLVGWAEPN